MKFKMKTIIKTAMMLCVALAMVACSDDEIVPVASLEIDNTQATVAIEGGMVTVNVKSNTKWTATSSQGWAIPSITDGENDAQVQLAVGENLERGDRTDKVTFATYDGTIIKEVTITQTTVDPDDDYYYRIPVVFHVIYNDASNEKQYARTGYLSQVLAQVNELWNSAASGLNVEFVMAETDPDGNRLAEAGVDRVHWNFGKIDPSTFMGYGGTTIQRYRDVVWDLDRYVNICVFAFASETASGVSALPFTLAPDSVPGLTMLETLVDQSALEYSQCLAINNEALYTEPGDMSQTTNFVTTIAHELGHYFGLKHVFSETGDDANTDSNEDTDYCTDTPSYNRYSYLYRAESYLYYTSSAFNEDDIAYLTSRTSITGDTFTSMNIMDYYYGYRTQFSPEQVARIRHTLLYSPYIPGPKKNSASRTQSTHRPARARIVVD